MIVPEKTIAFYPIPAHKHIDYKVEDINNFIKPLNLNHKRDWFTPHFYKCLPLSIGNMQGFSFSTPFAFEVLWNGETAQSGLRIKKHESDRLDYGVNVRSEFGFGIFTIHFPLILRTPPGVNLMTIAPPNFPTPGIMPMTGVVETDNLEFTFTLNFKINEPNMIVRIPADAPLMGILPVPRYFCDSFELKNAYDIFDEKEIEESQKIVEEQSISREIQNQYIYDPENNYSDGRYYRGENIRGKKFADHQLPKKPKRVKK
jgi:hypothetical protein